MSTRLLNQGDILTREFRHRYAGNGWIVLAELDDEWSIIAAATVGGVSNQHHHVWTRMLTPGVPLQPKNQEAAQVARAALKL